MENRTVSITLSTRILFMITLVTAVFFVIAASCSPANPPVPITQTTPSPEIGQSTEIPTPAITQPKVTVWIPADFLATHQKEILDLLNEQANGFVQTRPDLTVEFRTREDIINWLSLTSRAAPEGLPDLVLVDHDTLEIASLKGLLHPISAQLDTSQWESHILQTGMIQATQFGLPVVADALVLYEKKGIKSTTDLSELFHSSDRLGLDLSDPRNSLVLSIYLSFGGAVEDAAGRPILEEAPLRQTLSLIQAGRESGAISTQQNTHAFSAKLWQEFVKRDEGRWIGWYSQLPQEVRSNGKVTALPAYNDGQIRSIGSGWYWALSNTNPLHAEMTNSLLHAFTEPELLDQIAKISGWLPVNQNTSVGLTSVPNIQTSPDGLILVTISPVLQDSVLRVLSGERPELVASQTAALFK